MFKAPLILISIFLLGFSGAPNKSFVTVKDTQFFRDSKPYTFLSANFWSAMNLAARAEGKDQLIRELDQLESVGVQNLRILAMSEGPDSEPWRVTPSVQPAPGNYNEDLLKNLDFVLSECRKRQMTVVMVLGNFWPWSGGFAQYVQWATHAPIPYPPPADGGDWKIYQDYAGQFYTIPKAVNTYHKAILKIVSRYKDDPTVFSWQLANEPRGNKNRAAFLRWAKQTASLIHRNDPNHLVSLGSEGDTPYGLGIGNQFEEDHKISGIDYMTLHVWAQNWDWYNPEKHAETWPIAVQKMQEYIRSHELRAIKSNKPLIIEEFGLGRDQGSFSPQAKVAIRDDYYKKVFDEVLRSRSAKGPIQGIGFWAWSGDQKPKSPLGGFWKSGDPLLGDPPHERQGWYGVYSSDESTLSVLKVFEKQLHSSPDSLKTR